MTRLCRKSAKIRIYRQSVFCWHRGRERLSPIRIHSRRANTAGHRSEGHRSLQKVQAFGLQGRTGRLARSSSADCGVGRRDWMARARFLRRGSLGLTSVPMLRKFAAGGWFGQTNLHIVVGHDNGLTRGCARSEDELNRCSVAGDFNGTSRSPLTCPAGSAPSATVR
jgi:hypothetical protein